VGEPKYNEPRDDSRNHLRQAERRTPR
jgi:hypothetical protein